jgi:tetratricopeptide (TPR) repeat protein
MKSAVLEREHSCFDAALKLIEEGIAKYPKSPKLYMMGGQICSDDLPKQKSSLDKARNFYQRGLQECPNNTVLWKLASLLEERAATFEPNKTVTAAVSSTKARSLLELARLKNPKNPELWQEAVRLERRSGNPKLAVTLMAKALQECPTSDCFMRTYSAPRVEQNPPIIGRATMLVDAPSLAVCVRNARRKGPQVVCRAVILDHGALANALGSNREPSGTTVRIDVAGITVKSGRVLQRTSPTGASRWRRDSNSPHKRYETRRRRRHQHRQRIQMGTVGNQSDE